MVSYRFSNTAGSSERGGILMLVGGGTWTSQRCLGTWEERIGVTHASTRAHTAVSCALERKQTPTNGRFVGNSIIFSAIEKMRINKDPIFLAAVFRTDIYLNVDPSRGLAHPEAIGHGAQMIATCVWNPTSPKHIRIYLCALGKSIDNWHTSHTFFLFQEDFQVEKRNIH